MRVYFDDVIFLLQGRGGISRYWNEVTNLENAHRGIRVFFGFSLSRCRITIARLFKFIPILFVHYPVYHSSYQRPLIFKGKTKVVLTIHDCIYERFESGFRRWIHVLYTSWAIRQADHIIAVSESTARDILLFYRCDDNKISVIHNGCDPDITSSEVNGLSFPYLLYVGSRGYCKNFFSQMHLAAKFLNNHENFRVVLVGGGSLTSDESDFLNNLGIADRILIFRGLTDSELRYVYQKSHALLIQSIYEGFGIPVVEAAQLGCPVLCSRESSFPEIVGEEYPGMIGLSKQFESINFLEKLLDSEYRESVKNLLINMSEKFSWKKSKKLHNEIYNNLLC